jgi:hypothetical protein
MSGISLLLSLLAGNSRAPRLDFEATIIADYDARTAVERELVLRLASLLWRIRRATGIETDLLRIQAEILRERRQAAQQRDGPEPPPPNPLYRALRAVIPPRWARGANGSTDESYDGNGSADEMRDDSSSIVAPTTMVTAALYRHARTRPLAPLRDNAKASAKARKRSPRF